MNDLVKVTVYERSPDRWGSSAPCGTPSSRARRPDTYLEVAGLARPDFLVGVEGEAVKE